jgi:hypothetical protein
MVPHPNHYKKSVNKSNFLINDSQTINKNTVYQNVYNKNNNLGHSNFTNIYKDSQNIQNIHNSS